MANLANMTPLSNANLIQQQPMTPFPMPNQAQSTIPINLINQTDKM